MFDVIAAPYLGRTPRAMAGKLQVLARGTDMVLAEHYTPVHRGRLTAATLETVTFDLPHTIGFRLVRGPVPYLTEEFTLAEASRRDQAQLFRPSLMRVVGVGGGAAAVMSL